jgi:hypothetical protein
MCGQNIKKWFRISMSYLVYSQIWLNLTTDDRRFFNIFLWMMATLATKKKFFKKKHWQFVILNTPYFKRDWMPIYQLICSKVDTRPTLIGGQQLLDHFHGMSLYPLLFTHIHTHHYNPYTSVKIIHKYIGYVKWASA